jgi:hypothetical protein
MAGQPDLGVIGVPQIGAMKVSVVLWAQARGTGIGAAVLPFSADAIPKSGRATPGCCQPARGRSDSENRS